MEYRKRNFFKPRIGQQLGNYHLVRLLGRGSFADVYLGEHIHLNTQAAIKVLDMRLANDDMGDFLKEARTIANLKHPSIIQILEFGVENNTPFLVMEYAPNGTLRSHFPRGSRFSPEDIQPYVMQIASALQYAHDEKLIHRDIKPENMLLGINDEVLLADFGIAIVAHSSRTQSMKGVAGTVAYMAPEQLRGMPVKASDQYALAAVMYEWLTGKSLFQGSFVDVATHQMQTPPPPLSEQVLSISPMVESAILKALSKDPAHRFASVQEFANAFANGINNGDGEPFIFQAGEAFSSSPTEPLLLLQNVEVLPLQETTITTYNGHTAAVNAVAWSPGNRQEVASYRSHIASGSDDGTVQVWEAMTGHKISTYRGHSGGVSAIAWSPDGRWVASAGIDSAVQVWAADSMRKVSTYTRHTDKVTALAWSPARLSTSTGQSFLIASASVDSTVQVWDAATGQKEYVYRGRGYPVHAVAWSPDGRYIASAGEDMTVQVWRVPSKDVPAGKILLTSQSFSNTILTLAWSPDGKYIASGGANQLVEVWEVATGAPILTYDNHKFTVSNVAWSPEGTRIASASFDRTVQIWDATTGENAVIYPGHSSWVYAVAWAQGGQYIASASSDKTVQVWLAV